MVYLKKMPIDKILILSIGKYSNTLELQVDKKNHYIIKKIVPFISLYKHVILEGKSEILSKYKIYNNIEMRTL